MSEEVKIGLCDGEGNPVASVEQSRTPNGDSHRRVFLVANVPEMDDQSQGCFWDTFRLGESFVPSPVSLRFGYEEIAPFLAFLSPWLLSLANLGDGWPPLTELDLGLFDAVSHSDIERAIRLIDQGANVNALDKDGNTPLTELGYALWWNYRPDDPEETVRKVSQRERIQMMPPFTGTRRGHRFVLFCRRDPAVQGSKVRSVRGCTIPVGSKAPTQTTIICLVNFLITCPRHWPMPLPTIMMTPIAGKQNDGANPQSVCWKRGPET